MGIYEGIVFVSIVTLFAMALLFFIMSITDEIYGFFIAAIPTFMLAISITIWYNVAASYRYSVVYEVPIQQTQNAQVLEYDNNHINLTQEYNRIFDKDTKLIVIKYPEQVVGGIWFTPYSYHRVNMNE